MTQSAAISRPFTFDTVFDGDQVIAPVRPKRSFALDEVETIRTEAFAAGERSAVARAEEEAATALAETTLAIRQAMGALTRLAHEHRSASAELALTAARKIADAALEQFPEAPVAAALAAMAREIEAVPRLMIRSGAADPARLEAALHKAADAAGYKGHLVFKAEPGMSTGAFVFDWGDGRAAFDPTLAATRIQTALEAALAAEGLHAEAPILENLSPDISPDSSGDVS